MLEFRLLYLTGIINKQGDKREDAKRMKTSIVGAVIIFSLCIMFGGCGRNTEQTEERQISSPYGGLNFDSRRSQKIMAELWDAIEAENGEKIAEMLSAGARNEIEDYEGKIDTLIKVLHGKIINVMELATASSKSRDNRKTTHYEITGIYEIETTVGTCRLEFNYIAKDKSNPEEEGLYRLSLKPYENISQYRGMCQGADICVFLFED